jgi:hypothetical protein
VLGANNLGSHKGQVFVRVKPMVRASQYFMRTPDAVSDNGSGQCEWGHQVAMVQVELGTQGLRFEVGKRPAGRFAKLRLVYAKPWNKTRFLFTHAGVPHGRTEWMQSSICGLLIGRYAEISVIGRSH